MKADADPNLIVYFGGQYMPLQRSAGGDPDTCAALWNGRV